MIFCMGMDGHGPDLMSHKNYMNAACWVSPKFRLDANKCDVNYCASKDGAKFGPSSQFNGIPAFTICNLWLLQSLFEKRDVL